MIKKVLRKIKRKFKKTPPLTAEQRRQRLLDMIPDGTVDLEKEQTVSLLQYKRDRENKAVNGLCVFTDKSVYSIENGECVAKVDMCDITEFIYRPYVGLVGIEYIKDGLTYILCKSDMSVSDRYSKLTKRLNAIISDGKIYDEDEDRRICPKCSKPYPKNSSVCINCVDKKAMFARVWGMTKPYRASLLLAVVLFFGAMGVNLLSPLVNKILVDGYINNSEAAAIATNEPSSIILPYLLVIASMLGVYLLSHILSILRNLLMMQVGMKFIINLRKVVFEKIQQMSLAMVSRMTSGELMKRITSDTATLESFIIAQLPNLLQQVLLLLGIGIILFIYDPLLAALMIVPVPFVALAVKRFHKYTHKIYHKQWHAESKSSSILFDILSGIRVVKAFGTEQKEEERYDNSILDERDIAIKNEMTYNLINPIIGFVLNIGSFFLLYYTGDKILGGEMSLGEASMFSSYVTLIYGPINWLASLPRMLTRAYMSMIKVFDVLDEKSDVADKKDAVDIDIDGNITFENVSFGYDEGGDVLKGVTLDIKKGEMIGIVGKSGVGKSTLINLVMRLYDVTAGAIKIDGIDLRDISQHSLRSQIGVVLQESFLFSGTVYENIAYAKPDCTKTEVIEAAKAAGAHSFIIKLPYGYDTRVGEKGYSLSGGERQRVAIARALLHNPKILILDEATSALDTETEKNIQDTLQKLIRDRTTIAIAHRLSTLRNADRLVVLDKGKVAEVGSHEELLKNQGIYYNLVMAQRQMSKIKS